MDGSGPTGYSRWFSRVVLFGVFVNISLAIPTLVSPNLMMELLRRPLTHEPVWPRFAAVLLIALSVMYLPGARDPVRNRLPAWVAVLARFSVMVFFLATPYRHDWALFGWMDGAFFAVQGSLLVLAERAARARGAENSSAVARS